jgi:F-type H+-transporting ATPase subunit a
MVGVFPQDLDLFGFRISDTVVSTWVMIVLVTGAAFLVRRRWPAALEGLLDFLASTISQVMGRPAEPYLPLLGSMAIFIGLANVIGAIPVLTTPTGDINTPLALSVVVLFAVHYFGIRERGGLSYLKSLASPVFMLPLEIIGQLSRTLSLTLRLFGNTISTNIIVAVVFMLLPAVVPLPAIAYNILTGAMQAYIFIILTAVFIGQAVQANE